LVPSWTEISSTLVPSWTEISWTLVPSGTEISWTLCDTKQRKGEMVFYSVRSGVTAMLYEWIWKGLNVHKIHVMSVIFLSNGSFCVLAVIQCEGSSVCIIYAVALWHTARCRATPGDYNRSECFLQIWSDKKIVIVLSISPLLWWCLCYYGILCVTMVFSVLLWYYLCYYGILCVTMVFSVLLWHCLCYYGLSVLLWYFISPSITMVFGQLTEHLVLQALTSCLKTPTTRQILHKDPTTRQILHKDPNNQTDPA
jgi:hypothetical protein